jgi:hypothetical protein
MAKKRKNHATTSFRDVHDHRADELAFDLMSEARDITFDVVERNNSVITLHAHANSADVDPIVVIVTATDYIVDGAHCDTVAQTIDALTSAPTN